MAYKGKKRIAVFKGGARKKPANVVAIKCAEVAAAIAQAKTLPESCRSMLATSVKPCLAEYAADRHTFQVQTVEMAAKALAGIKANLEQEVTQAQTKVDSADSEKASRIGAADSAAAKHDKLEKAAQSAKEAYDADVYAASKTALKDAEKAVDTKHAELLAAEEKKARLEAAIKDVYEPFKATKASGQEGRKAVNGLEKVVRENGTEEALAEFLAETLKKEVDARGSFDAMVIKEIDERVVQWSAGLEAAIKACQQGETDVANAKTAAEAAHAAAVEKLPASKAALDAAQVAEKEQRKVVAVAKAAVQSFEKDMVAAAASLVDAKNALASFVDGPAKSFEELKVLAPPPPEPEPEAPAAEAVPAP